MYLDKFAKDHQLIRGVLSAEFKWEITFSYGAKKVSYPMHMNHAYTFIAKNIEFFFSGNVTS